MGDARTPRQRVAHFMAAWRQHPSRSSTLDHALAYTATTGADPVTVSLLPDDVDALLRATAPEAPAREASDTPAREGDGLPEGWRARNPGLLAMLDSLPFVSASAVAAYVPDIGAALDENDRLRAALAAAQGEGGLAEREFLAASVAVWQEIDRLAAEPGGYRGLDESTALRRTERAAWERYRDGLPAAPPAVQGGGGDAYEQWQNADFLRGACYRLHTALTTLVALKDGPRDDVYRDRKDAAWQAAREALDITTAPPVAAAAGPGGGLDREALGRLVEYGRLARVEGMYSWATVYEEHQKPFATFLSDLAALAPLLTGGGRDE